MAERLITPEFETHYRVGVIITGLHTADEAFAAARLGADGIGILVKGHAPSDTVDEKTALEIMQDLPPRCERIFETHLTDPDLLLSMLAPYRGLSQPWTLQLQGPMFPEDVAKLREAMPEHEFIKVFHVIKGDEEKGSYLIPLIDQYRGLVNRITLDTMRSEGGLPLYGETEGRAALWGGTGNTHNWALSAAVVSYCRSHSISVTLGGGLYPPNVLRAINAVRPDAVEASTRLKNPSSGELDESIVKAFIAQVDSVRVPLKADSPLKYLSGRNRTYR